MLEGIEGVSTYAKDVDNAFIIVTVITLFLFVVTIGSMMYFVFRYKESNNSKEKTKNIKHYTPIEIAWTVIPTILMMIVFYFGLDSLRTQRTMPKDDDAILVKVLGQRWTWQFEYQNGKKSQELYIPVNQNIKLEMTAPKDDVLHSFYIPAFRAKEDVIPGQKTYLWFNISKKGKYNIQCAEYCGMRHSYMQSFVNVVSKNDFEEFLIPDKTTSNKTAQDIFNQYGCIGCHTLDGTKLVGPSFKDIYNKKVTVETNGKTRNITRDEQYLRNSVLNPRDDIVQGFPSDMMPPFKGNITEDELNTVIEFFKSSQKTTKNKDSKKEDVKKSKEDIKNQPKEKEGPISGLDIIKQRACTSCHSLDGSKVIGPTFKNIYGKKEKIKRDSEIIEITVDEEYIKQSILNPKADVVEGYPNLMPSFKGILKEEEIEAIIKYLKDKK